MFARLEKIDPSLNQQRFYVMHVSKTLFGEWCLIREWGRIGSAGGRRMTDYATSKADAIDALKAIIRQKSRRGYAVREEMK